MSEKPRALMTAYTEGHMVSRELRDMLASETEAARFDRELRVMQQYDTVDGTDYSEWMHETLAAEGAL